MAEVYSGSHLNIAASGAKDASAGCFFPKDIVAKSYVQGPSNKWFYIIQPKGFRERITEAPLSKRAWAMQERFLPSRTIFFTEKEVFWECHEKFVSETDPQSQCFQAGFHNFLLRHEDKKQNFSNHLWVMVVHGYTKCELTMARDKLVAISGIARLFELKMKNAFYVAGMWRKDLELQLCWRVENKEGVKKPAGIYIAPSWSWASTTFPVCCSALPPEVELFSSPRIENLNLKYETADRFGQIKSASLQMSCLSFARVTITLASSQSHSGVAYFGGPNPIYISIFLDWDSDDECKKHCYILPLTQNRAAENVSGLMLVPTKEKNGQYKRTEMFSAWFEDCAKLKEAIEKCPLQNEEQECLSASVWVKRGEKRYWIELV